MSNFKKNFKHLVMLVLAGFVSLMKRLWLKRGSVNVRVLIFHGVENAELSQFNRLIERLSNDWNFITPEEFFAFSGGELDIKSPSLLVTFDDGFKSSGAAARDVLDKYGIKAVFFLISDFVGCDETVQIKKFSANQLRLSKEEIENTDCTPLTSFEANELFQRGHIIASHSKSHARMSSLSRSDVEKEMQFSRESLQGMLPSKLGYSQKITEFAFPFGDIKSISKESVDVGFKYYRRLYTGCRGANHGGQGGLIFRDAVNLKDPPFYLDVYLSGIFDQLYRYRFKRLLKMWGV